MVVVYGLVYIDFVECFDMFNIFIFKKKKF